MKFTKSKIRQIIQEEIARAVSRLSEGRVVAFRGDGWGDVIHATMPGMTTNSYDFGDGDGTNDYYKWIAVTAQNSGAKWASFEDDGLTSSSWIDDVGPERAAQELQADGVPHPDGDEWTASEVDSLVDFPVPVAWLVHWVFQAA